MENALQILLSAFLSAFYAIFPAMFCTIIPAFPVLIIFNSIWVNREATIYSDHAGEIFTSDMARAEMAKKFPTLYKIKFVYSGIILFGTIGIVWLIAFTLIYALISYLPIFFPLIISGNFR